jgi:hypothetical protein
MIPTPEQIIELFRSAGCPLTHVELLNLYSQVFTPISGSVLQGARRALLQDGVICKFGKVETGTGRHLESYGLSEWIGVSPALVNGELEEIDIDD